MKPAKKRPSKRNANLTNGNPIIGKLMKLKYSINDAYRDGGSDYTNIGDKKWVMGKIEYIRYSDDNKLSKEDMLKCNELWDKYNGSYLGKMSPR